VLPQPSAISRSSNLRLPQPVAAVRSSPWHSATRKFLQECLVVVWRRPAPRPWCATCTVCLHSSHALDQEMVCLLRISETEGDGITTVHLEGSLLSAWVGEVRSALAWRAATGPVRMDLTELRYADAAGIELLRALQAQGIEIASSSPYSSALL
jgi:hypothetical protein